MPAKGKEQAKLFLSPDARRVLKRTAALQGVSMSVVIETLISEVLIDELAELERAAKESV